MRAPALALPAFALALAAAGAAACGTDPVHDSAVKSLGPEVAGIPQGEYHRAGQPCGICHGPEGPAQKQFVLSGTVFHGPANNAAPIGADSVQVLFTDDTGSTFQTVTDCVGNFFVAPEDWPDHPQFPVLVTIAAKGGQPQQAMQSHIGREPSCATCHQVATDQNYYATPGIVHIASQDDSTYKGVDCPVSPIPPGFGGP